MEYTYRWTAPISVLHLAQKFIALDGFVFTAKDSDQNGSTNEYETTNTILLPAYPNPFRDQVTIELEFPTTEVIQLAIYDLEGRQEVVIILGVSKSKSEKTAHSKKKV